MKTDTLSAVEPNPHREIGRLNEIIRRLQAENERLKSLESDAREYRVLKLVQIGIEEDIIDNCFSDGVLVKADVDEALGGEDFIPCTIHRQVNGVDYTFSLASTVYLVEECELPILKGLSR